MAVGGGARHCPVCGGSETRLFFELEAVPALCNRLYRSRDEARAAARGDLRLAFCPRCGFIFNQAFDPARVIYTGDYENSLHFSPSFRRYAEGLARRLIERHGVRGRRVVEVACGNGEFLSLPCELGDNQGVGYDPSASRERAALASARLELVPELFTEAHAREPAALLCCRHALEHVEDPYGFVRMLRHALEGRDTVIYFEVPNATWILEEHDLWDLIYEHVGYFTAESLRYLFERAGFETLELREDFGRQFLAIEARPGDTGAPPFPDLTRLESTVGSFARAAADRLDHWRRTLRSLGEQGGAAAVWGAGSKGITFANLLGDAPSLRWVVDLNPNKAGMFVAGTGHPISPPEALREAQRLERIVVMNPLYRDEIERQLESLGVKAELESA